MSARFLEDFAPGQVIASTEWYDITPENIHAFASEFDPQPIHLDPVAAGQSMFGGIIASGWHSLSVTMRLIVRADLFGGAPVVGVGVDNLRYIRPVRAGDRLTAQAEVLSVRPSTSHPDRGYLTLRVTTIREDGLNVLTQDWTVLVPERGVVA